MLNFDDNLGTESYNYRITLTKEEYDKVKDMKPIIFTVDKQDMFNVRGSDIDVGEVAIFITFVDKKNERP